MARLPNPKSATDAQRHRQSIACPGTGSTSRAARLVAGRRVQLHADRNQPITVAEFGQVGRRCPRWCRSAPHPRSPRWRRRTGWLPRCAAPHGFPAGPRLRIGGHVAEPGQTPHRPLQPRHRLVQRHRVIAEHGDQTAPARPARSPASRANPARPAKWARERLLDHLLAAASDPPWAPAPPPSRPCGSTRPRPSALHRRPRRRCVTPASVRNCLRHGIGLRPRLRQRRTPGGSSSDITMRLSSCGGMNPVGNSVVDHSDSPNMRQPCHQRHIRPAPASPPTAHW